jgi:tetratricopeptide (TPR) repeat protein
VLALGITGAVTGAPTGGGRPVAETTRPADPLDHSIVLAQQRLRRVPADSRAWAGLALDYVTRARVTGDPAWYAKADGAVGRALSLDPHRNDLAFAAQAALASARHDFAAALVAARRGLAVNPYSAALLGASSDALTQLGRYAEAARDVERLNRLHPGVPAFTRAAYVMELRGDVGGARGALSRALGQAGTPADVAFVRGLQADAELRYGGRPAVAMQYLEEGLRAAPRDAALLAGLARALVALGRDDEAVSAYRQAVETAAQPGVVLEQAELLQALHRPEVSDQLALFRALAASYQTEGLGLDVELVLFEADHGSPSKAVAGAAQAWRTRPFLSTADAYAWALYRDGRPRAALAWSDRALATGWHTALHLYHRGMIEKALGRTVDAREHLQGALRLEPRFSPLHAPLARKALAELG